MTKLELLRTYTHEQIRDTWANTGSAQVSNASRYFNKDALVRCMEVTAPLYGALFYVEQEGKVADTFDWINYTLADPLTGEIQDANAIIHPYIYQVLSTLDFGAILAPIDPLWIPYTEPALDLPVIISETELQKILIDLGVPFISIDELEYTREQILALMIQPALDQYFRNFPIEKVYAYGIYAPNFDVEFPEGAVSVLRANSIPGLQGTGPSQGPNNPLLFWYDEFVQNPAGGMSMGYSTHSQNRMFRPNENISTMILERAVRSGLGNYMRRKRIKVYTEDGRVKGYCTERSTIEITFGFTSNDWNKVPHNMQPQVRDLAKAYVLKAFAQLRQQARSDIPGTLNYQEMLSTAYRLEKEVIDLWQQSTKSAVMRS